MALGSKRNIIVGAAAVFLGPANVATPADITRAAWVTGPGATSNDPTTTAARTAGFRNVGFTQDGFEVSTDPSYAEVEVDQLLDTPFMFKDGMSISISTTFAEATLENLLVAWGQQSSTLASTASNATLDITGGDLGDAPVERGLIAIGNSPRKADGTFGERVYHAYNVISVEGASTSQTRATEQTIPVTFRAMPNDDGKYGIVRETRG